MKLVLRIYSVATEKILKAFAFIKRVVLRQRKRNSFCHLEKKYYQWQP